MADNKQNIGEPDRGRVSGSEGYEVGYFARKHDLTLDQARTLIAKHGNQREALDRAAQQIKKKP